jgi:hypothetical protein
VRKTSAAYRVGLYIVCELTLKQFAVCSLAQRAHRFAQLQSHKLVQKETGSTVYVNSYLMTKLSAYSGSGSVVKLHFPRTDTMLDTLRSVATRQSV